MSNDVHAPDVEVTAEEEEDEDDDSDDDDPDEPPNLEHLLEDFRKQWHEELFIERSYAESHGNAEYDDNGNNTLTIEKQAKEWFLKGIDYEQRGFLEDAVLFYRRAIQLVPDIENKIDYRPEIPHRERQESESSVDSNNGDDDFIVDEDLQMKFQRLRILDTATCRPEWQQRYTHISALPLEVIMYIFNWVVSVDLDLRSLEQLSLVCRGFFMCARDDELWRCACLKVWGVNCGRLKKYGCWRNMYIERPHLRYNGVYISKSTYIRQGERTLNNYYRPWHLVEYYRYVRFFPDGVILMLTSPEDPLNTIQKLRHRMPRRQGLLHGFYKMTGADQVTAILKRVKTETPSIIRYRRNRQAANQNEPEQTFHVLFKVAGSSGRKYSQLVWSQYAIHTVNRSTGDETVTGFELNNKSYPPLYFSRVRSYTLYSSQPLK